MSTPQTDIPTDTPPAGSGPSTTQILVYVAIACALMLGVYIIYINYAAEDPNDIFRSHDNSHADDDFDGVVFDDRPLEKDAPEPGPGSPGVSFDRAETRQVMPGIDTFEELPQDDVFEIIREAQAVQADAKSPLETLREIVDKREFRHAYINNILRYYKSLGRMLIELEENIAKEEKISGAHVGMDKMIDTSANTSSLREIKGYYAKVLRSRSPEYNLHAVIAELDGLSGRDSIKDFIAGKILAFGTNYKSFVNTFQHTMLMAPAGYGKTHVAKLISRCLSLAGIVREDRMLVTTKKSFVSPYVNHTATLTRNTLMRSVGGLLFIDEAYSLADNSFHGRDHGHEAVAEIVNFIDKYRGLNLIIAAGYQRQMEENFLGVNEGMSRRFPTKIVLEAFTPRELAHICVMKLSDSDAFTGMTNAEIAAAGNLLFTLIQMNSPGDDTRKAFPHQAGSMDNLSARILAALALNPDPKAAIVRAFNR